MYGRRADRLQRGDKNFNDENHNFYICVCFTVREGLESRFNHVYFRMEFWMTFPAMNV